MTDVVEFGEYAWEFLNDRFRETNNNLERIARALEHKEPETAKVNVSPSFTREQLAAFTVALRCGNAEATLVQILDVLRDEQSIGRPAIEILGDVLRLAVAWEETKNGIDNAT